MSIIRAGDRLRLTIICEADELVGGDRLSVTLPQRNGIPCFIREIPLNAEGVDVQVLTPKHWPPIEGDVWEDSQKVEWYIVRRSGDRQVSMINTVGDYAWEELDEMLALRAPWRMVHAGAERQRREQEGEPPF